MKKNQYLKMFLLLICISFLLTACPLSPEMYQLNFDDNELYHAQSDKEVYKEATAFAIDVQIQEDEELLSLAQQDDIYIDRITDLYDSSTHPYDHHEANDFIGYVDVDQSNNLAVFDISGDQLKMKEGSLTEEQMKKIKYSFSLFTDLIPKELRSSLKKVNVYDNNGTAAYISFEEDSVSRHILGLNVDEMIHENSTFIEKYQIVLLFVHELAHLISMQEDQIRNYGVCFNPLGQTFDCHLEDSYMNRFNQFFWANVDIYFRDNSYKSDDDLAKFYELNKEHFLNSYAASNPYEDFAESFMTFVTEVAPENQNRGLDKKIMFFYQYEEMVLIRKALLQNIVAILDEKD